METREKNRMMLPALLIVMLTGYVLLHDLAGGTLLSHSAWDSYTLQALAWREGKTYLSQNYTYLELAIYQGRYYVSFPPVPSLVMLPLTFIFGGNTPNNLVMAAYAMATVSLAYLALRRAGTGAYSAAATALFYVWGSNMLWMSMDGGVWFQAQSLCMLLSTGAVCAAQRGRRILAYALIALAVGCRPFVIVAFIPLCVYFFCADRAEHPNERALRTAARQLPCLILPALIGGAYMWYNYIRFDSVLEFGHNYLPEFTGAEHGQFWIGYLGQNLYNIFLRPITLKAGGALNYPFFDGFIFYIANPIYIVLFFRMLGDIKHRRLDASRAALLIAIPAGLVLLCMHKTFGGWQFGARYTVDYIPLVLAYMLYRGGLKRSEYLIAALGLMFNAYGAAAMNIYF